MRHTHASRAPMRTGVLIAAVLLLLAGACGGGGDSGDEPTATASSTAQPESYTVVAGDTLASIAGRLGLSVAELVVANGIADPDLIEVGQVLVA